MHFVITVHCAVACRGKRGRRRRSRTPSSPTPDNAALLVIGRGTGKLPAISSRFGMLITLYVIHTPGKTWNGSPTACPKALPISPRSPAGGGPRPAMPMSVTVVTRACCDQFPCRDTIIEARAAIAPHCIPAGCHYPRFPADRVRAHTPWTSSRTQSLFWAVPCPSRFLAAGAKTSSLSIVTLPLFTSPLPLLCR